MNAKKPLLNFIFLDNRWKELSPLWKDQALLAFQVIAVLLKEDFSEKELSIVLMNDKDIQELNTTFRNQNKPTNVLSFPSDVPEELGDILLAYETVHREAIETDLTPPHHILHLIVHGFLHLLGYDHEQDDDAETMEALEINILKHLNISNPYEDR